MAIKFFSSKSNRDRKLRQLDVGVAVEVDGKFGIETPDDEPARDINADLTNAPAVEDFDDGAVTGYPAYEAEQPSALESWVREREAVHAAEAAEPVTVVLSNDEPLAATFLRDEVAEVPAPAQEGQVATIKVSVVLENAVSTAQVVANALGLPVTVHGPKGALLQTVEPQAKPTRTKATRAKATGTPRGDGPSPKTAQIIELACRPEGVTRPQLTAAIGWGDKAPWTSVLKNAAERFGYELTVHKEGGRATYFFTKVEAESEAA